MADYDANGNPIIILGDPAKSGTVSSQAPTGSAEVVPIYSLAEPPPPPTAYATTGVLGRTRELFIRLAAPFGAILDFVYRITEASEYRIYENGNNKISE